MVRIPLRSARDFFLSWLVAGAVFATLLVHAQAAKEHRTGLDALAFAKPEVWTTSQGQALSEMGPEAPRAIAEALARLEADAGSPWLLVFDRVTGKPHRIEGTMPWIPGTGMKNTIRAADLGVTDAQATGNGVPVSVVRARAEAFLRTYPGLFGVEPSDLVLMEGASGPVLDYLYNLNYQWTYHGIPVENAHLGFYLNSGNLVMVGQENISEAVKGLDPRPRISVDEAWGVLWRYMAGPLPSDEILEPGRLLVQPVSTASVLAGAKVTPGTGLGYSLVYDLVFRRKGSAGTWEARIDAHTGEIVSFGDKNDYGHIQGGVYKTDADPPRTEVKTAFPYADYIAGGYADAAGNYPGTGNCTLTGYPGSPGVLGAVAITDKCGAISMPSTAGLIDFGTSSGTDCTTPGVGGSGNTHSARTQYWSILQIKSKAYTFFPGNAWLEGLLAASVNLTSADSTYCASGNAWWDGSALNFCATGTFFLNFGESPETSMHEFGHGLDSNDGNGNSPDRGTSEAYGDTTALLQTHQSCLFTGILQSGNCGGYGWPCTGCTGIREADYAAHNPATAATPLGFNRVQCQAGFNYDGPCGREGHCEDAPVIQANWDLAVRDLTATPYNMDLPTAWQTLERLWYATAVNRTGAFACGNNTSTAAGALFNQYRVADDCDGDLTNGTPHTGAIWAALGRHQIADAAVANLDGNCGCANRGAPSISAAPGSGQAVISRTSVPGAVSYRVYRNEVGCSAGFTKVGTIAGLTFTDTPLADGLVYYYRMQANGTGSCPSGAMSNCVSVRPTPCTEVPSGFAATSTCTGVSLSWSPLSGATGYTVVRGSACGLVEDSFPAGAATSYFEASGVAGTPYFYWVVADLSCGPSLNSACAQAQKFITPDAPKTMTATGSCAGIQVVWAPVAGATSYTLYRGNRCDTPTVTIPNATSPFDDKPPPNYSYDYFVTAEANGCVSIPTPCATAIQSLPPVPPSVVTVAEACSGVTITWNTSAGATGYDLMRGTTCGTALTTYTNVTSPFTDTTGTPFTTYQYWVAAVNACGPGADSACVAGTLPAVPAAPAAPTFTGVSCTSMTINWSAVTGGATYDVYRAAGATCSGAAKITATPVAGISYNDTSLALGTQYSYFVVANGTCGTSTSGACASFSTLGIPAAPTGVSVTESCTGVTISWNASPGATSYNILRGTTCGSALAGYNNVTSPYFNTAVGPGITYQYWVVAVNACGTSGNSICMAGTRTAVPVGPTGLGTSGSCSGVSLSWTAASGASAYNIYRATACASVALVASGVSSPYLDTTGVGGTPYQYRVASVNACGQGGYSFCVAGTRSPVPAAPAAPHIAGSTCTSLILGWAPVSGATSYDLYRGSTCTPSTVIALGLTGTTYLDAGLPNNTAYVYDLVAHNACGFSPQGNCLFVTTAISCTVPPELAPGGSVATAQTWTSKTTQGWPPDPTTENYIVSRGTLAQLPALADANLDSCLVYYAPGTYGTFPEDPSAVAGRLYWYLVTGYNFNGEGTAGIGAAGPRVLNRSGNCP